MPEILVISQAFNKGFKLSPLAKCLTLIAIDPDIIHLHLLQFY